MKSLSLLIKPVSGACNMRCQYCFYTNPSAPCGDGGVGVMAEETLETLMKKALAYPEKVCGIDFQGGEPTLAGLDFFHRFIDLESRYNTRGIHTVHTIQTNGLLIDDEWADFFARNKFHVSVSLDAVKQIHDRMRKDDRGRDTHNRIIEATRLLRDRGVELSIVSVVTRALARHPDKTYRYFKDKGFRHVQFIPCMNPLAGEGGVHPHALDAVSYGRFLCRVFDLWYADFMRGDYYSIRMFDNYVHMLAGTPPEICSMSGRCRAYLVVEADGGVFPCDFYTMDGYRLGDIVRDGIGEMLEGVGAKGFVEVSKSVCGGCVSCEYFLLCRGGCRRDREPVVGGELGVNVYCESYRMFFEHALPRLRTLSEGLLAAQV